VQLLVKKLGRGMPESVIRQELKSLNIRVQGVKQLRSGRRKQDPAKDLPPTPHFIVSVARGSEVSRVQALTEPCGLRVLVVVHGPERPIAMQALPALWTRSVTADTQPSETPMGSPTSPAVALPCRNSLTAVAAEE
jgi:hypothetical protein